MDSKYNVLINYKGEGEFKFTVKKVGEVSITKDKPVFLYNADVDTIDNLRQLRRMLIEIAIGAKPNGAYKILDLDDYNREASLLNDKRYVIDRRGTEAISNNEVKSILSSGSNGPIELDEPKKESSKTTKKKSTKKSSKK